MNAPPASVPSSASPASLFATDASLARRRRQERIARAVLSGCALVSVLILVVLLWRMVGDGIGAMTLDFFTNPHRPSGIRDGTSGIYDAIMASVLILGLTLAFAVPVGVAAGIYLHEYAPRSRVTDWIRATVSNLAGVPSVVYGLLGLAVFVRLLGFGASYLAAALTLGVLILPILIVATEEALKTVPDTVRQAALGLGATKWQTIRHHVLPYALPGILTGNILALSRAAGETAPLLIITLPVYNPLLRFGLLDGNAPLQTRVFFLAQDARAEAHDLAAGGILVLLMATLLLNATAILLRQRLARKIRW